MGHAQTSTATPQWKRGILPCTILGCIAELISEKLDASGLEATMSVGITAFIFFLTALIVGRLYGAASGFNILSIGLGIALGTLLGAVIDPTHNLWPFTIVIFWVIGAIPVTLGVLLGSFWRARLAKRSAT